MAPPLARKPKAAQPKPAPGDKRTLQRHEMAANSAVSAALVMEKYSGKTLGDMDLQGLADEVAQRCKKITEGDMSNMEAMLGAQALSLQGMFVYLARRAAIQEQAQFIELYTRLAFKAQAQCVRTVEALGELKNPRSVAFINNRGPQQVNLGSAPAKSGNPQNGLLEEPQHVIGMEPRAQGQASAGNPHMATVGAQHRPEN